MINGASEKFRLSGIDFPWEKPILVTYVVEDIFLVSRLYRFVLLRIGSDTHLTVPKTIPIQNHDYAKHTGRCPLGMRVADLLVHQKMHSVMQEFTMEFTLPVYSEQGHQEQRRDPRRSVREAVTLRMMVADKAGHVSGHVIDMTTRGLCLMKPLRRGQYLTLKVSPNDGTPSVLCDLVKVQWVKEDRAGVAFLSLSHN